MSKIFTRARTRKQELQDQFLNSFYKGGFIDEELLHTKDRDFWESYKEMMTDVNSSGIYESILVATKEEPYREDVLERLVLKEYDDDKLYVAEGTETYVSTSFRAYRFIRCIFIHNPMMYHGGNRLLEIKNTVKQLSRYEKEGFLIEPTVMDFLKNQCQYQSYDSETTDDEMHKHLFITAGGKEEPQIVTLLIPLLENGAYYNINDILSYPYITEMYHYYKSKVGQIKFSFKIKTSNKKARKGTEVRKCTAYFSYGWDTMDPEFQGRSMFYTSFFKQYYNPFLMFDPDEINLLVTDLYEHYELNDFTRMLISNTLLHYNKYFVTTREAFINRVPANIQIHNPQDSYFEQFKSEELLDLSEEEDDMDDEPVEEEEEVEADIEEEEVVDPNEVKRFSVNRTVLSLQTLKSLILGHNDRRYYGFYGHLADTMLKITDMNPKNRQKNGGQRVNLKYAPRSQQLIKTISSNPDLFSINNMTSCWDCFYLTAYKKNLYDLDTNSVDGGRRTKIKLEDRFQKLDEDYGKTDSVCVRSEKTVGVAGSKNMLAYYADDIEYRRS